MAATLADLKKLIGQATPRIEDVRSIDRTDIIRRDHGHLNLREVSNSADALEFSVDSFIRCMREVSNSTTDDAKLATPEVTRATDPDLKLPKGHGPQKASEEFKERLVEECAKASVHEEYVGTTAVHGLLRAVEGLCLLTSAEVNTESAAAAVESSEPAEEAKEGWQAVAADSKKTGGEAFKNKDFSTAWTHYSDAIRATPAGDESLSALFSNRSAVLLQLGRVNAALADAQSCVKLTPEWPKGHFRNGTCLRQLGCLEKAASAFRQGQELEPSNKDWAREVEKTESQFRALPSTQARQLVWHLLPELVQARIRSGTTAGVLQVQVNGELADLGAPKWQFVHDRKDAAKVLRGEALSKEAAKAQMRWVFLDEQGYMANLAANLQSPPEEGVAVVDLAGQPLKIADIRAFFSTASSAGEFANFHIDVKHGGKMVAIIGRIACDEEVRRFAPPHKDPQVPKGDMRGVLQVQARSGFAKVLPKFLGFQSYPGGDLNFPVIDLERDAPGATPGLRETLESVKESVDSMKFRE